MQLSFPLYCEVAPLPLGCSIWHCFHYGCETWPKHINKSIARMAYQSFWYGPLCPSAVPRWCFQATRRDCPRSWRGKWESRCYAQSLAGSPASDPWRWRSSCSQWIYTCRSLGRERDREWIPSWYYDTTFLKCFPRVDHLYSILENPLSQVEWLGFITLKLHSDGLWSIPEFC